MYYVGGTIPSELCGRITPLSIDVAETKIKCYSGCLTSSNIIITGANNDCHDGNISNGSGSVFVNGLGVARVGDPVSCGSTAAQGSQNVFAG